MLLGESNVPSPTAMTDLFRPFGPLLAARFVRRPNRFLVECDYEGRLIRAFLPSPWRLQELLLPGSWLYIVDLAPSLDESSRLSYPSIRKERRRSRNQANCNRSSTRQTGLHCRPERPQLFQSLGRHSSFLRGNAAASFAGEGRRYESIR